MRNTRITSVYIVIHIYCTMDNVEYRVIGKRQSRRHARSRDLRSLGRANVDPAAPSVTWASALRLLPSLCLCLAPANRHLTRMARLPCFARLQLCGFMPLSSNTRTLDPRNPSAHTHQIAILNAPSSHCYSLHCLILHDHPRLRALPLRHPS